jgi:hypothetical protein
MIWKRRRLLILTLAVACIGAAVGTAFSVVTQTASDPQTRDEVYHEGMSLQEFAAAATGQPGEIAPRCPDDPKLVWSHGQLVCATVSSVHLNRTSRLVCDG